MPAEPLSYGPPLLPDEPLDGWLEHIAGTLHTSVTEIARICGVQTGRAAYHYVRDLGPLDIERLAAATNQPTSDLYGAMLQRWSPQGLTPPRIAGGLRTSPWQRRAGARFCPDCFESRNGRWRLTWYLHWSFACVEHQRLLLDACSCGCVPRTADRSRLRFADRRPDICKCLRQLTWTAPPPPALGDSHPIIRAQVQIDRLLTTECREPTVAGRTTDPQSWFADLTSLTRAIILLAAATSPAELVPLMETEDQRELLGQLSSVEPIITKSAMRQLGAAASAASHFAPCAALAADLLDSDDVEVLTSRLERLPAAREKYFRGQAKLHAASSALTEALGGRSNLTHVLRAAQREAVARRPASARLLQPCHLPSRPYANLVQRHPDALRGELAAAATAMALLGWPNTESLAHCAALLGLEYLTQPLLDQWARTVAADHDLTLFGDVVALRALLGTHGSPIDYERRRHTFPEPTVLADRVVRPVVKELEAPLTRAMVLNTSLHVYEQLSGSDALLTRRGMQLPGAFRIRFRRLRTAWHQSEPASVTAIVEAALLRKRINEPVRWEPSFDEGAWVNPEPDYTRNLSGWDCRELRGDARHRTPGRLRHASIEQVVDFAFDDTSTYARNLQTWLTAASRLNLTRAGTRAAQAHQAGLGRLSEHLGRPLMVSAAHGRRHLRLTNDGVALLAAIESRLAN